jgi:hypothetical protein
MRPRHALAAVAAAVVVAAAPPSDDDELKQAVTRLASGIRQELAAVGGRTVRVADFLPKGKADPALGPTVRRLLSEEFAQAGVPTTTDADLIVGGTYLIEPTRGRMALVIDTRLTTAAGKPLAAQSVQALGLETVARFASVTGVVPTDRGGKDRERVMAALLLDDGPDPIPAAIGAIDGTVIRASADSPYGVEVHVRPAGAARYEPRIPTRVDGKPFVTLQKDECYAVRVLNGSDWDAAIKVMIDGLNVFHFSESSEYRHFVVPKGKAGKLIGWPRSADVTDLFRVAGPPDGVNAAEAGVIEVQFARAWAAGDPPPSMELAARLRVGRGDPLATARGPEVERNYAPVDRVVGDFFTFVAVRYSR